MLLKVKNYLKYKIPKAYDKIRNIFFPIYLAQRDIKLKKFKKGIKQIEFMGIKYNILLDPSNGFVDQEIYWKGIYEEEVMEALFLELFYGTFKLVFMF